ncbi:hypothetical protein TNCV_3251681 [Trichonephila clavipes]|nr:hypothetical protein TNCV_3251681 [Trichonephila clavipes]
MQQRARTHFKHQRKLINSPPTRISNLPAPCLHTRITMGEAQEQRITEEQESFHATAESYRKLVTRLWEQCRSEYGRHSDLAFWDVIDLFRDELFDERIKQQLMQG